MDLSNINKHLNAVSQDLQKIAMSFPAGKDYKKFTTDANSHLNALRNGLQGQVPQKVLDNLYQASVNLTNMTKAKSKDASFLGSQVLVPFRAASMAIPGAAIPDDYYSPFQQIMNSQVITAWKTSKNSNWESVRDKCLASIEADRKFTTNDGDLDNIDSISDTLSQATSFQEFRDALDNYGSEFIEQWPPK